MKNLLLSILLLLSLPALISRAQEAAPTARPDIDELLTVSRVQKMYDDMFGRMKTMMGASAKQFSPSAEASANIKAIQDKTFDLVESEMSWDKVKGEYTRIYAEVYTPEEVRGLIAFYKTPTGQAFLDKQPILMQKTMEMTQKMMADIGPKLQAMILQNGPKPALSGTGTGGSQ